MPEFWAAYVRAIADGGHNQAEIGRRASVGQTTVSRWLDGSVLPQPAAAAALCRSYRRNPLEGFVAAGMLTEQEAGRSLTRREREFLHGLVEASGDVDAMLARVRLEVEEVQRADDTQRAVPERRRRRNPGA